MFFRRRTKVSTNEVIADFASTIEFVNALVQQEAGSGAGAKTPACPEHVGGKNDSRFRSMSASAE